MSCCVIHDDLEQAPDLLVLHHKVPQAWGGLDVPENRCYLCASCHDVLHKAEQKLSHGRRGVAHDLLERFLPTQPARVERLFRLVQIAAAARQQPHDTEIPEAGEPAETVLLQLEIPRWLHHRLKQLALEKNSGLYRYCGWVLEQHGLSVLRGGSAQPTTPPDPVVPPLFRLR
jgi:hypothetical protein